MFSTSTDFHKKKYGKVFEILLAVWQDLISGQSILDLCCRRLVSVVIKNIMIYSSIIIRENMNAHRKLTCCLSLPKAL